MNFQKLNDLMISAQGERMFTGAAVLVSRRLETLFEAYYGTEGENGARSVTKDTLFDLASLTKVLATTPCWMVMAASNPELLERKISHWFADAPRDKAGITPRHLLAHCSGLPTWRPYYLYGNQTQEQMNARIFSLPLEYEIGHGSLYSDLGFMLLASILELETGQNLSSFAASKIYEPLGLDSDLLFLLSGQNDRAALTREDDPPGIVNDLNARCLGGVSGHAGLFGTARGVAALAEQFLSSLNGSAGLFDQKTIRSFCDRAGFVPGCTRALGFDTPSEEGSTSGDKFSRDSIGHTGFTGVSLWIDIPREIVVVLLTNRVYMGESDFRIKTFRPLIHNTIMEFLD